MPCILQRVTHLLAHLDLANWTERVLNAWVQLHARSHRWKMSPIRQERPKLMWREPWWARMDDSMTVCTQQRQVVEAGRAEIGRSSIGGHGARVVDAGALI